MAIVKVMMRGASKLDPAQDEAAWAKWKHLEKLIDVRILRQTHDVVSPVFRHGRHKGQCVEGLTDKLLSGAVVLNEIPVLVVVRLRKQLWVVFGNRRLKALKAYQNVLGGEVLMRCLIHNLDSSYPRVPHSLVAKFISSTTTANEGLHASFSSISAIGKRSW